MDNLLRDYQYDAVDRMKNGCILNGGTGSGKSITSLYYYFKEQGGINKDGVYREMTNPKDLYIITTAKKRDDGDWIFELARFYLSTDPEVSIYDNKVVIDSWNNIGKYARVKDSFFIFDEDKVTGSGKWAKTFIHISKNNDWILLSATPGDQWMDYMPVFIANGFYKGFTDFKEQHVVYDRCVTKYPKIKGYYNTGRLMRLRNKILIEMKDQRQTVQHHEYIYCNYDRFAYKDIFKNRWNYEKDKPIENASQLCYAIRKISNTDVSRCTEVLKIIEKHGRAIIFYNFDYELEILKNLLTEAEIPFSECNGHRHEDIPTTPMWAYLVQYNSGAEGWNCTSADTMIFYSQNYSYKITEQATGRIDRINTPFIDLYYYHLKSRSPIDIAIANALARKKKFNESRFVEAIS